MHSLFEILLLFEFRLKDNISAIIVAICRITRTMPPAIKVVELSAMKVVELPARVVPLSLLGVHSIGGNCVDSVLFLEC